MRELLLGNVSAGGESITKMLADKKKVEKDYRMPIIQNLGLTDQLIQKWPIVTEDNAGLQYLNYWKTYNNITVTPFVANPQYESELAADETFYEGDDERERFLHNRWFSHH